MDNSQSNLDKLGSVFLTFRNSKEMMIPHHIIWRHSSNYQFQGGQPMSSSCVKLILKCMKIHLWFIFKNISAIGAMHLWDIRCTIRILKNAWLAKTRHHYLPLTRNDDILMCSNPFFGCVDFYLPSMMTQAIDFIRLSVLINHFLCRVLYCIFFTTLHHISIVS